MIEGEALLVALVGPVGAGAGYLVRRWLATERPFLATIEHQDREIAELRSENAEMRAEVGRLTVYVHRLVLALVAAGIDVPPEDS